MSHWQPTVAFDKKKVHLVLSMDRLYSEHDKTNKQRCFDDGHSVVHRSCHQTQAQIVPFFCSRSVRALCRPRRHRPHPHRQPHNLQQLNLHLRRNLRVSVKCVEILRRLLIMAFCRAYHVEHSSDEMLSIRRYVGQDKFNDRLDTIRFRCTIGNGCMSILRSLWSNEGNQKTVHDLPSGQMSVGGHESRIDPKRRSERGETEIRSIRHERRSYSSAPDGTSREYLFLRTPQSQLQVLHI